MWYTPAAIAKLKCPTLPLTAKGVRDRARKERWPSRKVRGRGGREGMRTEYQPPAEVLSQIIEIEERRAREGRGESVSARGVEEVRAGYTLSDDFVMVPRYDVVGSAGNGALIHSEQIVDHLAFRADWVKNALGVARKDLALISVKGDSMEPTLSEGDLILVDTGVRQLEDSAVYVLRKGEGLFVKRVHHKLDGTIIIKSDNSRYEPETYGPELAPAVQVVGRVVWVGRRL